MHGFALAENIDFISKKLDKWRHPEAWQDGVREIQSARLSRLRVYDSDSENACRDESGLKRCRSCCRTRRYGVRMNAALKAD